MWKTVAQRKYLGIYSTIISPPEHSLLNLLKTRDKENNIKVGREKQETKTKPIIVCKWKTVRRIAEFLSEIGEDKRQYNNFFKRTVYREEVDQKSSTCSKDNIL